MGTIGAIGASLYLTLRDRFVRLEITAGHRPIVAEGVKGPHPEYLLIEVVNIGHREAQVTNLGWKVGLFRHRYAVQIAPADGLSSKLPIRLKDGDEANYLFPLNEWLQNFPRDWLKRFPKMSSRFLKVYVSTSIGKSFTERIEPGLRKMIIDAVRKPPQTAPR